ncbi:beta strand repeat-containing protein, partial [Sphingomonas colocasiae]
NLSEFAHAEKFILSQRQTLSTITTALADALATPDNGILDGFSGTLSWAIYSVGGNDQPGVLLFSGTDTTPLLVDTGQNFSGSFDIVRATIDLGVTLDAGSYFIVLHEGAWGSPSDGSEIYAVRSSNPAAGAVAYSSAQEENPIDWSPSGVVAFSLAGPDYAAIEQVALNLKGNISVADADAGSGSITVTLGVGYGILTVTAGTSGANVSGSGTNSVTLTGTPAQINDLLNTNATSSVSFTANTDTPPASTTLSVNIDDNGNGGSGGALTGSASQTIAITAVNDAPTAYIAPPGMIFDRAVTSTGGMSGISHAIAAERFTLAERRTLSTFTAALTDTGTGGNGVLDGFSGTLSWGIYSSANGEPGTLLFSGTDTPLLVDSGLDSALYERDIIVATIDLGNVTIEPGTYFIALREGALESPSDGSLIWWMSTVADPAGDTLYAALPPEDPSNWQSIPSASAVASLSGPSYMATEQIAFDLKGRVSVDDADAGSGIVTVTLGVGYGILTVTAGTSGANVSGSGTGTVTLTGTLAQINDLLNANASSSIGFTANTDTPPASTTLSVSINDNGNSGGSALTGTATQTIDITAVNDAPMAAVSASAYAATEQVALSLKGTVSVADDSGNGSITVTLGVGYGILTVTAGTSGANVSGSGTNSVTLTGTLAQINDLLNTNATSSVSFTANTDTPPASTTLTVNVDDNGNSGSGGALTGSASQTIAITAVNDAPTVYIGAPGVILDQAGLDNSAAFNLSEFAHAEKFILSQRQTLSTITTALADALATPDNGILDGFSGTLSWAIYSVGGNDQPGVLLFSGTDTTPLLVDTGLNRAESTRDIVMATIDMGVTLDAGSYFLILHEGAWGSLSDGSEIFAVRSSNPAAGAIAYSSVQEENPIDWGPSSVVAFSLAGPDYAAIEQVALNLKGNISVADVDAGNGSVTVTLGVGYGILTVTAGTSGANVSGSGTGTVTLTGTLAQINDLLNTNATSSVTFTANTDTPPASTTLSVGINDGGNTGSGGALTGSATQTINITAVNDVPVGNTDSYSTDEDTQLVIAGPGVLTNDTDAESDALSAVLVEGPGHGTLSLNPNGSFTYTPDANYNGGDSFTYRPNDGTANGNVTTVNLTVNAVNDAPTAAVSASAYAATEQVALSLKGTVSVADADAASGSVTVTLGVGYGILTVSAGTSGANVSGSGTGSVTLTGTLAQINDLLNTNATSSVTFTANTDTPPASTTLTVGINDGGNSGSGGALTGSASQTIAITAVNDLPVGVGDNYATDEDTALVISAPGVLSNDTDAEGSSLTAVFLTQPAHGTLLFYPNGSFTYTPDADWHGTDSFTYMPTDGVDYGNATTVTLTVNSVNDAPANLVIDSDRINEGAAAGTVVGTATASDVDGDTIIWSLSGADAGLFHIDANGVITTTGTTATFESRPSYSLTVRAADAGGLFTEQALTVVVNDRPVAVADALAIDEGKTSANLWSTLIGNDTDGNGDVLAILSVDSAGTGGHVIFDAASQSLKYVADAAAFDLLSPGQTLTDSFKYTVTDAGGLTSTATVTFTVTAIVDGKQVVGGGRTGNVLTGTADEDTLYGFSGAQSLNGMGGDDTLIGGAGNDTLTGGAGKDVFVIGFQDGHDVITDYTPGHDVIRLAAGMDILGTVAADTNNDQIVDLRINLEQGGSVTLLGISDINQITFA